jgi:serine/threonine kinase 16
LASYIIISQQTGFSFVYLVKERTPGASSTDLYALKRVRIQLPEHETRLRSEIAAHNAVNSPYVLKLLDSVIVKRPTTSGGGAGGNLSGGGSPGAQAEGLLLLPFCAGGTVQDLIDRTPVDDFVKTDVILRVAIDVAKGLKAFQ